MIVKIERSRAKGQITAPPSKSMAHRALICGALSQKSEIKNLAFSKDIEATLNALKNMGALTQKNENTVKIGGLDPYNIKEETEFYCNESGSTLRFLLPLCMLSGNKVTLKGAPRLFERPLTVYEEICKEQDIFFEKRNDSVTVCGKLKSGTFEIDGGISSQFISGLMFALSLLNGDSSITVLGQFESESYVDLTIGALRDFGIQIKREKNTYYITGNQRYRNCCFSVEGDESNAAFLDAFNLLGGDVKVDGLNPDTLQGDRVYKSMYTALKNGEKCFDLKDCPDLAPVMFALASQFGGAEFINTARLKIKESDRAQAMAEELEKLGIKTEIFENSVKICGGDLKTPTNPICSHNDHRIVMAMALLLTLVGGSIEAAEAVEKSYPTFFEEIRKLGIRLDIYDN